MIKINKREAKIEGKVPDIMTELSILIHTIKEEKILSEDLLKAAIETGLKNKQELIDEVINIVEKKAKKGELDEILKKVFDALGDGKYDF